MDGVSGFAVVAGALFGSGDLFGLSGFCLAVVIFLGWPGVSLGKVMRCVFVWFWGLAFFFVIFYSFSLVHI